MTKSDTRFKNRRRMAWIAFWFMLFVGGWMLFMGVSQEDASVRISNLSFLLGTLFGMCTTIVVGYFTSTTMTDVNDTKHGPSGTP